MLTALGLDPGYASTGVGAVMRNEHGRLVSRGVQVIRTEKNKDKRFTNMRTSMDDCRRTREIWTAITRAIALIQPQVIGVEAYTVYEPPAMNRLKGAAARLAAMFPAGAKMADLREHLLSGSGFERFLQIVADLKTAIESDSPKHHIGLGAAAKTMLVYGVTLGAAFAAGVPVFVFLPADLKKPFGGKAGASKDEVGAGIFRLVEGAEADVLAKVKRVDLREHATDALGHGVLALQEYEQLLRDSGRPNVG